MTGLPAALPPVVPGSFLLGSALELRRAPQLVRPGVQEFEPVNYEVIDSTHIKAIFDLRDAPHGLYDVKVINPNWSASDATARVPRSESFASSDELVDR